MNYDNRDKVMALEEGEKILYASWGLIDDDDYKNEVYEERMEQYGEEMSEQAIDEELIDEYWTNCFTVLFEEGEFAKFNDDKKHPCIMIGWKKHLDKPISSHQFSTAVCGDNFIELFENIRDLLLDFRVSITKNGTIRLSGILFGDDNNDDGGFACYEFRLLSDDISVILGQFDNPNLTKPFEL